MDILGFIKSEQAMAKLLAERDEIIISLTNSLTAMTRELDQLRQQQSAPTGEAQEVGPCVYP
jgi:hypothetical protein